MRIVNLGVQDYLNTWKSMQEFTISRDESTADQLWIVEHPATLTQGISGKPEHILVNTDIPIVQTDRGGQVTYHGPGQLIIYCLIDLRRIGIGVKKMVRLIEKSIMEALKLYNIDSSLKDGAPGVYVDQAKIAALGLKVKNSKTYHGLSLNVDMDLSPFKRINPCGYQGLKVTQMSDLTDNNISINQVAKELTQLLSDNIKSAKQ